MHCERNRFITFHSSLYDLDVMIVAILCQKDVGLMTKNDVLQ